MTMRAIRFITVALLVFGFSAGLSSCKKDEDKLTVVKSVPIQHEGRIKSFEVFSRETLRMLSRKDSRDGQPASEVLWEILMEPGKIWDMPLIRVDYFELKERFGLDRDQKFFSFQEMEPYFPSLSMLVDSAKRKRDSDKRPSKLEQKAESLYSRLVVVDLLGSGEMFRLIPGRVDRSWESPYFIDDPLVGAFRDMGDAYFSASAATFRSAVGSMRWRPVRIRTSGAQPGWRISITGSIPSITRGSFICSALYC